MLDSTAVDEVLRSIDTAIAGKLLVNVTSGSPAQAREYERWARERGAEYIDGKIMADPHHVGTQNAMFLFSGALGAFQTYEQTLRSLGTVTHYGADSGAAAVEFLAQVAVGYEVLIGFLHALKLVQSEGVDVAGFAERVAGTLGGYAPLLTSFGKAISAGEYGPDLGSLNVQAALMDDLIGHRESRGVGSRADA